MILSKEPDGDLYGLLALAVTTLTHCALTTRGRSRNTFHDRSESRCPPPPPLHHKSRISSSWQNGVLYLFLVQYCQPV